MGKWSVLDAKFYSAPGNWCLPSERQHITETQNPEELLILPTEIDVETEAIQLGSEEWDEEAEPDSIWTEFYSPNQIWTSVTNISDTQWVLPDAITRIRVLEENTFENLKETRNVEEFNIFPEDAKVVPESAQAGFKQWVSEEAARGSWSGQTSMAEGWYIMSPLQTTWSDSTQEFYFYWMPQQYTPLFYWSLEQLVDC